MRTNFNGVKQEKIAGGRLQVAASSGVQDILITHTDETAFAAARFDRFVSAVTSQAQAFRSLSAWDQLIACVIAFEATCVEDLEPLLQALRTPLQLGDGYYVSWNQGEEVRRVKLCVLTLAARERVSTWEVCWDALIDRFSRSCGNLYSFAEVTRIDTRLTSMFDDRVAWCFLHLPMPLVSHLLGVVRMTLLPDSAWLRRFGQHEPELISNANPDAGLEPVEEAVVEILYSGRSQLSGAWFVDELVNICSGLAGPGVSMSDARAWAELSRRLNSLAAKLEQAGPAEALLLGWALDIATFGTARKKSPRVKTLSNYLRSGVRRIHAALRESGNHPLSLTDQEWDELFMTIEESGRDDLTLRPALASFQRYMVRSLDVAPIPRLWRVRTEVAAPKASVIWRYEFDAMNPVLDQMTSDPRMRDQLTVWTALLRTTSLRFGELAGLQMRSIQLHNRAIEIQVAPHRGHRPLKTAAARRILPIHDPQAIQVIRDWFERRKLEGADASAYLFGDPKDGRRLYRLGASYRIYSSALKLATSDPTMSIHGTRHAFLSIAAEDAFLSLDALAQVNPFHRLAVLAGHEHESTTLRTYVHLVEGSLRFFTDRAIQPYLRRYADTARWLNLSADTVRQRHHRLKGRAWSPWAEIEKRFCNPGQSPVDSVASSAPAERDIRTRPVTLFKQFMQIASDLLGGHSEAATGARNSVDLLAVSRVRNSILTTALASNGGKADLVALASRLNFSRLNRKIWDAAINALEQPEARVAVGALYPALRGVGIDVETASTSLLPALDVLKSCGFSAAQFVLRYANLKEATTPMPLPAMKTVRRFSSAFGATPQIEAVSVRRSRSPAYLLLLTGPAPKGRPAPPARSDIASLRTISMCASAFDHFVAGSTAYALEESS